MSEKYAPVTGGCFCGAVRYEAEASLHDAYYCHCRIYQKTTGAPAGIGVLLKPGSLTWLHEAPKFFQTSPFAKAGFCQHCGSRLINVSPGRDDWTNVSIGSLDHPEHVVPSEHTCVESQLPWYKLDDDLPRSRTEDDPELIEAWGKAGLTHEGKPLE
jgi:hypothetical protein